MSELAKFEVGAFDISGISEADLQTKKQFISKPGVYTATINEVKLYSTDKHKDAAGNRWGSAMVSFLTEEGYSIKSFVRVPQDSLSFVSKAGKTSLINSKIFLEFIEAVTGSRPALEDVSRIVSNLSNVLMSSTGVQIKVGAPKKDRLSYAGKTEGGDSQYIIALANGQTMLNADGEPLMFSDPDAARNYYKDVKGGFSLANDLEVLRYLKKA